MMNRNRFTNTPRDQLPQVICEGQGRTHQEFKDDCDINLIIAKAEAGIPIDHISLNPPMYGDFSNVDDFLEQKIRIKQANDAFTALPAWIRAKFNHDPSELLGFLMDSANDDEAIELGLKADPNQEEQPAPARTVPEPVEEGVVETPPEVTEE